MSVITPPSWSAQLDPHELKDYIHHFAAELAATSDTLSTSAFFLPSDAIAAGLNISTESAAGGGTVWFDVDLAERDSALWDGNGTIFRIRHQITTVGGRRLEASIFLTVAQK